MTVFRESVPTTVLCDHPCQLGEGPTYDAPSDTAWWFDITERRLLEHRFRDGRTVVHALPFMASQLSFIDDRRQLVAAETGLHIREIATGRLRSVQPIEAEDGSTRSNDGRVHPCGALWIGTMGKAAEPEAGAIYWFHRGELRRLFSRVTVPNAICFAADGTRAFFADTAAGTMFSVETDAATGLATGEPTLFHDHRGQDGGLDGAVMDADGVIWNARWGAGCIDAYSPSGTRIRTIAVPATQPSCPAFVGAKADRLLVTTARQGLGAAALEADPGAGRTLVLDLPIRGRPEPRVVIA